MCYKLGKDKYILFKLQQRDVTVLVCGLKVFIGVMEGTAVVLEGISHSFIVSEHEASNGFDISKRYPTNIQTNPSRPRSTWRETVVWYLVRMSQNYGLVYY